MEESRQDVVNGKVLGNHRLWMTMTAIIDRTESLLHSIYRTNDDLILHLDIDTIFRGDITSFMNITSNYDIGLRLRKLYPLSGFISIKNNSNGIKFIEKWLEEIYSEPVKDIINLVWGQLTLESVRLQYKDSMDMFEIIREDWENTIDVWTTKKKNKDKIYEKLKRIYGDL